MNRSRLQLVTLLAIPLLVLASMFLVFKLALSFASQEAGYLVGFAFYWLVWCLLVPRLVLGRQGFASLMKDQRALFSRANWWVALLWSVVSVVAFFMYGAAFVQAPLGLILIAIPMAMINGLCEETLWRGLYVRIFPTNAWMGIVYPAIGFSLWHFTPQIIFPAGNVVGFVLSALFLGLAYGLIAYRTGSARWTVISHSLNGILALSGMLAPSLLALLHR